MIDESDWDGNGNHKDTGKYVDRNGITSDGKIVDENGNKYSILPFESLEKKSIYDMECMDMIDYEYISKFHTGEYYSKTKFPEKHASDSFTRMIILNKKENPQVAILIAQKITKFLEENKIQTNYDLIVPVPNHPQSYPKDSRAVSIAKQLGNIMKIEYNPDVLEKLTNIGMKNYSQYFKSEIYRIWRLYKLNPDINIANKKILLVDDVITQGNTIRNCMCELKKGNPESITVICAAKTHSDYN